MSFADALAAERPQKGPPCWYRVIVMADQDRAELDRVLADGVTPAAQIYRALVRIGHKVDYNSLRRHRAGECQCHS